MTTGADNPYRAPDFRGPATVDVSAEVAYRKPLLSREAEVVFFGLALAVSGGVSIGYFAIRLFMMRHVQLDFSFIAKHWPLYLDPQMLPMVVAAVAGPTLLRLQDSGRWLAMVFAALKIGFACLLLGGEVMELASSPPDLHGLLDLVLPWFCIDAVVAAYVFRLCWLPGNRLVTTTRHRQAVRATPGLTRQRPWRVDRFLLWWTTWTVLDAWLSYQVSFIAAGIIAMGLVASRIWWKKT
jgi:hypothetical protein